MADAAAHGFRAIYVISGIWQHAGWSSIIYLAALSAIDPELYEAATIDGAGRFQQMLHITLPGIAPTITILLILDLGRIMSVGWEKILLLYTGATYETADVLQTYIYRRGLEGADFSYATAVGVFQGLVGLAFVIGANYLSRRLYGNQPVVDPGPAHHAFSGRSLGSHSFDILNVTLLLGVVFVTLYPMYYIAHRVVLRRQGGAARKGALLAARTSTWSPTGWCCATTP